MHSGRCLALAALLAASMVSVDGSAAPAPGAPGFSVTAVVKKFGTLKKGHGAISAQHLGNGKYTVTFAINVASSICGAVATVGRATFDGGINNDASFVTVANVTGDDNTLYVETRDKRGRLHDLPFNLMVGC